MVPKACVKYPPTLSLILVGSTLVFCSRLNTKLEANGYPPMTSLVKDLSDGVRLIQLMVSATSTPLSDSSGHWNSAGNNGYFHESWLLILDLKRTPGDVSLGRYNKKPRIRVQKAENVNKALEFITSRGVKLTNIGPEGSSQASFP
jgi:hypothetical protein